MLKYDIGTKSPVILGRIRVKLSFLCINCDMGPCFCPFKRQQSDLQLAPALEKR